MTDPICGPCEKAPRQRQLHLLVMGVLLVAACQACHRDPLSVDGVSATAEVSLALTEAPSDVACISIITAGTVTERRNFDVAPTQSTNLALNGLAIGKTVMTVEAFNVPCKSIVGAIANWLGGPVTIVLERGPNGRLVVSMRPNSGINVGVDFPPGSPPKVCGVVGSKCSRHSDCCSSKCTLSKLSEIDPEDDPVLRFLPGQSRGICKPDEPPAPTKNRLKLDRGRLAEVGGRAAFPSYDGDFLFTTFPPKAAGALTPNEVFARFVRPALLASGMQRPEELLNDRGPAGRRIAGGDFAALARAICNAAEQRDALSKVQCAFLQNPQTADSPQLRAMERGLGISLKNLQAEIARPLETWVFTQRVGAVPIEHHAVIATRYPGQQVTTVFGSFLNDQRVTNAIVQTGPAALRLAHPTLLAIEQLDPSEHLANQPAPVLVLLPYGADPADPAGARTALRYAYRGVLGGSRKIPDGGTQLVSFTVWVDAATGELLKSVRETEDAVKSVAGSRLVRDPTAPITTCSVQYEADDDGALVRLSNAGFKPLVAAGVQFASPTAAFDVLAYSAPNATCTDRDSRAVNAFATLSQMRSTVAAAGGLDTFPQVAVSIDLVGNDNMADQVTQSLSFARGNGPTTAPLNLCVARATTPPIQIRHGGALDGTVVAHEFAHLATAWMQKSVTEGCSPGGACPVLDPEGRKRFHDFADGYAAVLSETPCIGGWMTDNGACQVGAAFAPSETSALPRLLLADPLDGFVAALPETGSAPKPIQDAFPTHRVRGKSEYADGQIVGAALWHTRQGLISQGGLAASIPLLRWLNEGMPQVGLSNSICTGDSNCDADIYRPARELLLHLANSWANSDARASINKLLSAFARTGVFLPPYHCVDNLPNDTGGEIAGNYCPTVSDWAGDAIIDVTDQEIDEAKVKGVTQPDDDYLCRTGVPQFRIWTGPKFTFVDSPAAASSPNAPITGPGTKCNTHFDVEVSTDDATWTSLGGGQVPGGAVTTTTDLCRGVFVPSPADFQKATTGHDVVYYRVHTWHEDPGTPGVRLDERVSDQPGNGLWAASPPAISFSSRLFLADNGRPDPSVPSTCP